MDFLILRPLSPETGYHFFEGGGVGGGGVKSLCSEGFERAAGEQKEWAGAAAGQSAGGIRTTDLQTDSQARYRSTTVLSNIYGPHCL